MRIGNKPKWLVAVFFPCVGTHFWSMSQKRGRHAVARRGRAGALARRSAHSAFLGTSAKVVFIKIMSPRFCAFRPRRRVSAAPSRCARKPVKTPLKKMKFKIRRGGVSTLRWRGAHSGSRHTCAAPSWHGPNTTCVDGPKYSEFTGRWARTLAQPRRVTARRPLFLLVVDRNYVPVHFSIFTRKTGPWTA